MPLAEGLPYLGGYESYCKVVGGVLSFMGVEGFLANLDAMYDETDVETPQWQAFLEAWHETIGDKPVTAAELVGHLNDSAELRAALPDGMADTESKTYSVRLGQRLAKKNGVRYPNGFVLVKAGEKKRAVMWKVVRFETQTSPDFSLKSEVGEVIYTPAHTRENGVDTNLDKNRVEVETTSLTSPLASEKGEVAAGARHLQHRDEDIPDYPTHPCHVCGSANYWLRETSQWGKAEWLCSWCHPKPGGSGG